MTKTESEMLQTRYGLVKKCQAICETVEKRGDGFTAEERKTYDAAMAEVDKLGAKLPKYAGPTDNRSLDQLVADAQKISSGGVIEDVGNRQNVQGTPGRRGRDANGNEFRVWHPDEAISPYLGSEGESEARMGVVLGAAVTGNYDQCTAEERYLAQGSLIGGGAVVPTNWSREIIQAARSNLTASRVADVIEMPNGNITIPGVSGFPSASWVAEGGTFSESNSQYFALKLVGHKVGCYSKISVELADNASGIEGQIESDLSYATALAVDQGFYQGTGVNQPLGIKNNPNINSTDAANAAITLDNYVAAYWSLQLLNCPEQTFMVANPKWYNFLDLVKLAGAGLLYAFSSMPATTPSSVSKWVQLRSAALRNDTGNILDIYTLPYGATVLAYVPGGVRLEVFRGSDTGITTGMVFIRIYMQVDSGIKMPAWVHCYKNVNAS